MHKISPSGPAYRKRTSDPVRLCDHFFTVPSVHGGTCHRSHPETGGLANLNLLQRTGTIFRQSGPHQRSVHSRSIHELHRLQSDRARVLCRDISGDAQASQEARLALPRQQARDGETEEEAERDHDGRAFHVVAGGDILLWIHPVPDHGRPLGRPDKVALSTLRAVSELRPVSARASPYIARP